MGVSFLLDFLFIGFYRARDLVRCQEFDLNGLNYSE